MLRQTMTALSFLVGMKKAVNHHFMNNGIQNRHKGCGNPHGNCNFPQIRQIFGCATPMQRSALAALPQPKSRETAHVTAKSSRSPSNRDDSHRLRADSAV
jgi:hypothetical protein